MEQLAELFNLNISRDLMIVELEAKHTYNTDFSIKKEDIKAFMISKKITYGHIDAQIEKIVSGLEIDRFPVVVAEGRPPQKGKDGNIHYLVNQNQQLDQSQKRNFRDINQISSVAKGDKIAYITLPTSGEKGINILGKSVQPVPGKPVRIKAGQNVKFVEEERAFFSMSSGQLTIDGKKIHVYPVYEVDGDLNLEVGNISFVGSVTIHGSVPTGYSIEAGGDINVSGLVEAAFIKAGGSVYIGEGFAGMKNGTIIAGVDINASYINQGIIEAGRDIIVNSSIIHSQCVAKEHIYCQNGNIIGGTLSSGKTIEAKDIGNKMDTKTELAFGINKKVQEEELLLLNEKKELVEAKQKLILIGDRLSEKKNTLNGLTQKERILLLKQRHSLEVTTNQLREVEEELNALQVMISDNHEMRLIVKGSMYPNVNLIFHKYKRKITSITQYVQVLLDNGEISIQSL